MHAYVLEEKLGRLISTKITLMGTWEDLTMYMYVCGEVMSYNYERTIIN